MDSKNLKNEKFRKKAGEVLQNQSSPIIKDLSKDELGKVNRTLIALRHSSFAMMQATDEISYLEDVCKIIVDDCGYSMVWLGIVEEESKKVHPVAYAGFEEDYLKTLNITWDDTERGQGPTGTAIRTGKVCICENMITDPKFNPWREEAVKRGYASSIVLPLINNEKAFGTLNIYSEEPNPFSEEEKELLKELSEDISFGITSIRLRIEHEKAEKALVDSETKYHSLYSSMNEGVALHEILYNPDHEAMDYFITDINPSYETIVGLSQSEVVGKKASKLYGTGNPPYIEIYAEVAERGEPKEFETFFEPMDKHFRISVISPEKGKFATIFEDITLRKRAEKLSQELLEKEQQLTEELLSSNEELQSTSKELQVTNEELIHQSAELLQINKELEESEDRFRALADNIPNLAWMADANGWIFWYNKQWYEYTGTTLEEMQGWGWQKVHHPDYVDAVTEDWSSKILEGKPYDNIFPLKCKDGSYRWFLTRVTPIRDEQGKLTRWFGTNTDITDRKNYEENLQTTMDKLKQSNKELEQFAYITSHDLREPLRMITSFLQLLERRYKDQLDQDANEFIGFAVDGAKRLDNMTNDILLYSRITSQKRDVIPVNFEHVLEHALTNLKVQIEENNAIITHDPLPTIKGDEQLKIQLFQNIIGNAIKYRSQETPQIHISATQEKNQYLFSIKDNGIGMSPEHLKKIFTIFQRLHTHEKYEGTGIGLAIAQKIVHQQDGEIWVESEPGTGSTFYFTIPIKK